MSVLNPIDWAGMAVLACFFSYVIGYLHGCDNGGKL